MKFWFIIETNTMWCRKKFYRKVTGGEAGKETNLFQYEYFSLFSLHFIQFDTIGIYLNT
jgi:hypothetical protein